MVICAISSLFHNLKKNFKHLNNIVTNLRYVKKEKQEYEYCRLFRIVVTVCLSSFYHIKEYTNNFSGLLVIELHKYKLYNKLLFIIPGQIIMNSNQLLVSFVWENDSFEIIWPLIRTQNS